MASKPPVKKNGSVKASSRSDFLSNGLLWCTLLLATIASFCVVVVIAAAFVFSAILPVAASAVVQSASAFGQLAISYVDSTEEILTRGTDQQRIELLNSIVDVQVSVSSEFPEEIACAIYGNLNHTNEDVRDAAEKAWKSISHSKLVSVYRD